MIDPALRAKYDDLQVSRQLAAFIKTVGPQKWEPIFHRLVYFLETIKESIAAGDSPTEIMTALYEIIDKDAEAASQPKPPEKIQCKKGCGGCCHIQVQISYLEAHAILEYCQQQGIEIDIEYLQAQVSLVEKTHAYSPHSACVFLAPDNTCKIYAMRPINCRKYRVVSPPIYCNPKTSGGKPVTQFPNLKNEIVACAVWNVAGQTDSIARSLLQYRAK